jgi:hypothetical protein
MEYDSPKPRKRKVSLNDRILKNPITSLTGVACIALAFYMYKEGIGVEFAMLLGCAGLFGLGLKDKA